MTTTKDALRVVVTYRVCQAWRVPVFERLAKHPGLELIVLHGEDVPGTKLQSTTSATGFRRIEMRTRVVATRLTGNAAHLLFWPELGRTLEQLRPDVILAEGGSNLLNNLVVFRLRSRLGYSIVWWSLGEIPGRRYSFPGKLFRRLVATLERRADALLGYSSVARHYFERTECDPNDIFVALNCIDTDEIDENDAEYAERGEALRAGLTPPILLFVGALQPQKKVDLLIRCFARAPSDRHATLLVIGDGPDRPRLEVLNRSLHRENREVRFLGAVHDQVGSYFRAADVFVLPGLGGLAVSESLAHGTPVICGQGDGSEVDLVIPGRTGLRYERPPDAEYETWLTNCIADVINGKYDLSTMGRQGRAHVRDSAGISRYVSSIAEAVRHAHRKRMTSREA